MLNFLRQAAIAALIAVVAVGGARGYFVIDGHSTLQEMLSFACQASRVCPGQVSIDSTGAEKGTVANPVTVYNQQYLWTDLGFCSLAVSAAMSLTACAGVYGAGIPGGTTTFLIDFEGANFRSTGDGVTTPTSSLGRRHIQSTYWGYTATPTGLQNLKLACETSGCIANVSFLR